MQAVILFGTDTWVLMETTIQRSEGAHVIFLRQVTCKQATQRRHGSWRQVTAEAVLQGAGTQTIRTYVDRRQETMTEWVSTRTIFDVCAREMEYKGGGRLRVPWFSQKAAKYHLRVTVEAILAATRLRQRQKSDRRCGSEGGT